MFFLNIQSALSRLCITHRKRAKEIVETWDKLFNSSQKEQRVSFLYLANDILQNSRRKGSEFVNEFWKVLPAALRHVNESDEHGKKVVARLVDIWDERKVFGSRGQGLKDEMMGKSPLPVASLSSNVKSSNSIKIVKRDAHSVRIKLAVGCLPEKILTALHSVLDDHLNEEAALNKCNDAVRQVCKLVEDVENTLAQGNQLGSTLVNDLEEQENELTRYMMQLENGEAARTTLLSQLKDALQEQAARDQMEQAAAIKKRLSQAPEATKVLERNLPSVQLNGTPPQPSFIQPSLSFAPLQTAEDDKKAAAAAVAAKLAASTSSALMLTSILSSLVAEEAASMSGSLNSTGFTSGFPDFNPEKRPRLEKPMPASDFNGSDTGSTFFASSQQPSVANVPPLPSTSMQPMSPLNQLQAAFASGPSPVNPSANQYAQSTGFMVGGIPYGYGSSNLPPPPPPPLPPHVAIGFSRPSTQPQHSHGQQQQQQQQQPSSTGGFYRPPGIGFYGQSHPSTPPAPVPRQ
ncbi:hypothetical protein TanjilG_05231 [Lupinus angustifolius]|uniref:CID domain-containing protein n=1 Tax=Lupinus angustifolius TaxID=3871 RepID=A0A4P1RAW1_LUPAN|nr:hypothetical protein TanjilG_05231 [Lupinus angustifolius]